MSCPHCHPYTATHLQDKLGFFPEFFLRPVARLVPHHWTDGLWRLFIAFLVWGRIGSWTPVASDAYSGKRFYLWREAERRGWRVERLVVLGFPTATHRIKKEGRTLVVDDLLPHAPDTNPFDVAINDKAAMRRYLSRFEIPVPEGGVFWSKRAARRRAQELGSFVLKSRDGSLSKHVQVQPEDFDRAWEVVRQVSLSPLLEAYIPGSVFRATTVHGNLVAVARRDPVRPGEKIVMAAGARMVDVTDSLHPKNRELFERTARVVGGAVLGIDFITTNPVHAWDEQELAIIELNSFPNFEMHHEPHEGVPRDVAGAYWEGVLKRFDA